LPPRAALTRGQCREQQRFCSALRLIETTDLEKPVLIKLSIQLAETRGLFRPDAAGSRGVSGHLSELGQEV